MTTTSPAPQSPSYTTTDAHGNSWGHDWRVLDKRGNVVYSASEAGPYVVGMKRPIGGKFERAYKPRFAQNWEWSQV